VRLLRVLRMIVALGVTAALAFAAALVFLQVAGTLVFRDVPPLAAAGAGVGAALLAGGVAVGAVRILFITVRHVRRVRRGSTPRR
jgi:hypothetical protein